MPDLRLSSASLAVNAIALLFAAAVVLLASWRLATAADRLADRTGLGEAVTGTLFLGLTTALPGLAASVTAGIDGHAAIAVSNAIGGIAVQTAFLGVADIVYKRANLEHAAASVTNMIQTAMLIALLSLVLLGLTGPAVTLGHAHPVTLILFGAAAAGFVLVYRSKTEPMWQPRRTGETVEDVPARGKVRDSLAGLLLTFGVSAVAVIAAGAVVALASASIADRTGINETTAGAMLSGVATSLPELATTVAAVRRGALTLAVGDVVGGNFFDVLFVSAADVVYLEGSLYHAPGVGSREAFLTGLAISMNVVLLLGLLYRQRSGPGNIGFESVLMLALYVVGSVIVGVG